MMNNAKIETCPYYMTQKILAGKWTIYILYLLSEGPIRFNQLKRLIPEEITHTSLSRILKSMETHGLIVRTSYPGVQPRVEYSLSEIGRQFGGVLNSIEAWGKFYIDYMAKNSPAKEDGESPV